jgi:Rrf2 family protein
MKFTTKTEYGLVCLVYMARAVSKGWVRIHDIAEKERFSLPYIEKIVQKLRAANIVVSHQGKLGGYSLARDPSEITIKEIIEALEGSTFDIYCQPKIREHIVCTHFCMCGIRPVWAKTKELLDKFYASVTLEMIAKEERGALASIKGAQKKEAEEILAAGARQG